MNFDVMRRQLRLEALCLPVAGCTRSRHASSFVRHPQPLVVSTAYLWSNLHSLLSTCPHQLSTRCSRISIASFSTSCTTPPPLPPQQRYRLARDRLKLIRALQRESNPLRVLALADSYRRIIAPLPHHDAMIDTDSPTNPQALNHLCMSPHAAPLDYCLLIYHLLRVGAMARAAALINEMNIKQLSIRAAIRALFAHHLVVAGRADKAREVLAPELGDPAKPFVLDKADLQVERMQAVVLPPSVAILLMSPFDSPFFRSDLFQRRKVADRGWESVMQCFDFLRTGGHLSPHVDCYHHVMQRLVEVGQVAHCRRLFVAMQEDGVTPTTHSYLCLMRTLLREQLGVASLSTLLSDRASSTQNHTQQETEAAQVDAVAESRQRQVLKLQLLALHHEMLQKHIAINDVVYSLLIQVCCLVDDEKRAWQLFDEMRASGSRLDPSVVPALLSLTSITPRRVRDTISAALLSDRSVDTCHVFITSAVRRRSGADLNQLLDEFEASGRKRRIEAKKASATHNSTPSLPSLYSTVLAACNEAGMYDVTTQLFTKMREAKLPTTNDHHHAFIRALCHTGRVSLASAHLEQMPASFDLLPSVLDYCTVMSAAADMQHSDERTRVLTCTARFELFASLILPQLSSAQRISLDHYSTDNTAVLTVVRGLLLWMQWADSERLDERQVANLDSGDWAVRLSMSEKQQRCGVGSRVKAMLDESVSRATAESLAWRKAASGQWLLQISWSVVRQVRECAETEQRVGSVDERQAPVQHQAEQGNVDEHGVIVADSDSHSATHLTTLSAPHRILREDHAQ